MANDGFAVRRIHALGPSGLQQLFQDRSNNSHTRIYNLQWGTYGPVAQVRKTFSDIRELAEDIATRGMISMQVVFAFSPEVTARYLETTNLLWGTAHDMTHVITSELDGVPMCFVLVAGERRHRALTRLWNIGCRACRKSMKRKARNGGCFHQHFPGGFIPVSLKVGYAPDDALTLQLAENSHKRPKAHEEAAGFRLLWEVAHMRNPATTVPEFARSIGHPAKYVSQGLLFTNSAEYIQDAVAQSRLSFTAAIALARYHEERGCDAELRYWFDRCLAEGWTTSEIQVQLHEDLQNWKSSQLGLFGAAILANQEARVRQTFARGVWRVVQWASAFLSSAIQARNDGRIGLKDSPFATGGLARAVVSMYEMLAELVPVVRRDLREHERQRIAVIQRELKPDIEALHEEHRPSNGDH